jgi:hypothetical protein
MKVLWARHFGTRLRISNRDVLRPKKSFVYISISALLLSILTVVPAGKASADTAGTGSCVQTFTKTGTGTVDVVESDGYCYVAFKNSGAVGSQTSYSWTRPSTVLSADVLVIGGGGGGGSRHGGGGGAGSFVEASNYIVSSASAVTVVVGGGGAGAPGAAGSSYVGSAGQLSRVSSGSNGLIALGGGAGVNGTGTVSGGSGGGSGWNQTAGTVTPQTQTSFGGATISGITFGSAGISGAKEEDVSFDYWAGGGGGGAGGAGANPTSNGTATVFYSNGTASTARGGNGGAGKVSTILPHAVATSLSVGQVSSSSAYFAGGGGGGMGADGAAAKALTDTP